MARGIYAGVAFTVGAGGTVVVAGGATVEVKREDTNAIAVIWSDRAGTLPIANPSAFADANGRFVFYADGIEQGYAIKVSKGGFEYTLRNQPLGLSREYDATPFSGAFLEGATSQLSARALLGVDVTADDAIAYAIALG